MFQLKPGNTFLPYFTGEGKGKGGEFRSLREWNYLTHEQKPN